MSAAKPLLTLSLALSAGAWAGDGAARWQAWLLVSLCAALLLVLAVRPGCVRRAAGVAAMAAFGIGAAGMAANDDAYRRNALRADVAAGLDAPVLLSGHAVADLVPGNPDRRLVLDVTDAEVDGARRPWRGRVSLRVGGEGALPLVTAGRQLAAWASLYPPRGTRSEGVVDFRDRARRQGTHALGTIKSAALIEVAAGGDSLAEPISRLRQYARVLLQRSIKGDDERGLLASLVFGDRGAIDAGMEDDYRRAGVFHVLAVSGAQVALLAAIAWRCLRLLRVARRPATLLLCGAVAGYAVFAGSEASIVRAAVMAGAVALAASLDLDASGFTALGGAVFALVAYDPAAVFDAGFQLSVSATAGLIAFMPSPAAQPELRGARRWLAWLVVASLAAQAAVLPAQLLLFHTLPIAALGANLVVVPISSALLVGTVAFLAVASVSQTLAAVPASLLEHTAALQNAFIHAWAQIPGVELSAPTPPLWCLAAYCGGLVALALGRPRARAVPLIGAGFFGILFAGGPRADGRLQLHALDVGQGDALVLVSPHGRVAVIDTGPGQDDGWSGGRDVVAPFLWSRGFARIDLLVMSHAHADHIGGASWLARTFKAHEVWEGSFQSREFRGSTLRRVVGAGVDADWDGVRLRVLGPPPLDPEASPPRDVRNDDSVVVEAAFGGSAYLLTGDIEGPGEEAVGGRAYDLVKVAHHGSRTSSSESFVARTCPAAAFVSVGAANRFHHPHPEVIDRYRRQGAFVARTDQDGSLQAATDGEVVTISTFALGTWSTSQKRRDRCATIPAQTARDERQDRRRE